MTKAEYIERYGIEYYEYYQARNNARQKERYQNDPEYRKSAIARSNVRLKERYRNDPEFRESKKARQKTYRKERYRNDPEFRDYQREYKKEYYYNNPEYKKEYRKADLNSNGKRKDRIRCQSRCILFDKRRHSRLKGYEIHHCFGYEDPHKFIYIPKVLHTKIHQFLRDNNIDADSNHYKYIVDMVNECTEYTYISA